MTNQDIDCIVIGNEQEKIAEKYLESNLPNESAVLYFGKAVKRNNGTVLLVTRLEFPEKGDYTSQTPVFCSIDPMFMAETIARHSKDGKILLGIKHAHPMHGLSSTDMNDAHLYMLKAGFANFVTGYYFKGKSVFYKHQDGFKEIRRVVVDTKKMDRQIRSYGIENQMLISSSKILLVGLGGGGFVLAHYLATKNYELRFVDPDVFTESSRNRVWISQNLVDMNKAKATREMLGDLAEIETYDCKVEDLPDEVFRTSDVFVIFSDSITSRLFLNQKAIEFGKPAVFLGSEIRSETNDIQLMMGTCLVYTGKGSPCYNCNLQIDPNIVQKETLSPKMWKHFAAKYSISEGVPAPSIVELNSIVASIGADQITRIVTGYAKPVSRQYIDLLNPKIILVNEKVNANCLHCSDARPAETNAKAISTLKSMLQRFTDSKKSDGGNDNGRQ
ncbi:MAG: ThiF family adenylyltransferase [Candidatus Nitrosotenuis sp.]